MGENCYPLSIGRPGNSIEVVARTKQEGHKTLARDQFKKFHLVSFKGKEIRLHGEPFVIVYGAHVGAAAHLARWTTMFLPVPTPILAEF